MPPVQDESKLDHLINSGSESTTSLQSWVDENNTDSHLTLPNEDIIDEKFEDLLEKASTAFPKKATLETMIREAAGVGGSSTADIISLTLQVIGRDVSLQHLPVYAPKLNQLTLDGSVLNSLRDLGSGLYNLRHLSVNNCGLSSLDGIMAFRGVRELHVAGNRLRDLSGCVSLNDVRRINGSNNRIQDITTISLLSFCEKLEWLDIENNAFIGDNADYLVKIKEFLPQLQKLDGVDIIPATKVRNIEPNFIKWKAPIASDRLLPSIESATDKILTKRPNTTLPNCSYSVKFAPKTLSPRASTAKNPKSKDIESLRFELPKL